MTNFVPFSSITSSSFFGSSRAMPREGPDQPMDMVMRMAASALLSFRKSLMTSEALSVTVSIEYPPYGNAFCGIQHATNLFINRLLSITFLPGIIKYMILIKKSTFCFY